MKNKIDVLKQDDYLKTNILNMINVAQFKFDLKFTAFLDERQCAFATSVLNHQKYKSFAFFGGTNDCDRKMLGVFPMDFSVQNSDFPMTAIKISYSGKNSISHRDCLGSLMGLQINRDCIGDIIIKEDFCIVFVTNEIVDFLLSNLVKIGRANVKTSIYDSNNNQCIEKNQKFDIISGTVASMRLDCIVAFSIKKSRTIATEMITKKLVKVNYIDCENLSYTVKINDVIAIRGKGK
ncbi:MAG: YlmH/Sll1252 family protein, partial [Oscillospiraceae bacterium]